MSLDPEYAVVLSLDQHRLRISRFLDCQAGLRRQSAHERAQAVTDGRASDANLLDRFDECLAAAYLQLKPLVGQLEELCRSARNGPARGP